MESCEGHRKKILRVIEKRKMIIALNYLFSQ